MSRQISFPSIEQYRHTVKLVRDRANFQNIPPPSLKFHGTVKLHGTNAAVVRHLNSGETWAQSRTQVITPTKDNEGFAKFAEAQAASFDILFDTAKIIATILLKPDTHLAIYGEWCGQGIMKGVAINKVPKRFVIFGVCVWDYVEAEDGTQDGSSYWFNPQQLVDLVNTAGYEKLNEVSIYCSEKFANWNMEIDFIHPEESQNLLQELTLKVEEECPVGKAFGVEGIGEGIVWTCFDPRAPFKVSDLAFKVKGPKHSDTKVKTLASVDVEKVNSATAFANQVVTDHRLEKMLDLLKQSGAAVESRSIGQFLKLVATDVEKEETDTLTENGLVWKDVANAVNKRALAWFQTAANKEAGLA